jgi:hypothetical protein
VWRDLYTVSILLHRACVQAEGDIHQDIRDFDLAILMGGPLFRPEVDSAIQNRQLMYNMLLLRTPTPSAAATPNLNIRDLALSLSLTPSSTVSCAADAAATPVLLGTETPLSPPCHRSTTMAAGGAAASATAVPTVPAPQLDEMVERFMFAGSEKEGLPGVFTGAMQHWPALARWSDVAYLKVRLHASFPSPLLMSPRPLVHVYVAAVYCTYKWTMIDRVGTKAQLVVWAHARHTGTPPRTETGCCPRTHQRPTLSSSCWSQQGAASLFLGPDLEWFVAKSGPLKQYVLDVCFGLNSMFWSTFAPSTGPRCRAPHSRLDCGYLPHWMPPKRGRCHHPPAEVGTHGSDRIVVVGKQKLAGPRLVPVELGKNYLADGWTQRLMPFDRFLDQHVVRVMTVAADGAAASVKQPPAEQLQPTDEHLVAVPAAKRPRVSEEHPLGKREQTQPASDAGNEAGASDRPTLLNICGGGGTPSLGLARRAKTIRWFVSSASCCEAQPYADAE